MGDSHMLNRGDDSHLEAKCEDCGWVLSGATAEEVIAVTADPLDVVVERLTTEHEQQTGHETEVL